MVGANTQDASACWEPLDAQRVLDGVVIMEKACPLSPPVVAEASQRGFRPSSVKAVLRNGNAGKGDFYLWRGRVWVRMRHEERH